MLVNSVLKSKCGCAPSPLTYHARSSQDFEEEFQELEDLLWQADCLESGRETARRSLARTTSFRLFKSSSSETARAVMALTLHACCCARDVLQDVLLSRVGWQKYS